MEGNNISNVIEKNKCTGCSACYNICPLDAIEMTFSDEGFYVPRINDSLCTNCGTCLKVCPIVNTSNDGRFSNPRVYVAWSLDEKVRLKSSSGGIYPELAKLIIEQNGIVFSVGWNKEWLPEHRKVSNISEISETVGSKYVQSKVGLTFRKAIEYLNKDKKVLFVGTPCQVAGFRNFIKQKQIPEDNILLVDLVCHGVPSPLVFRKYLTEIFGMNNIVSISFRDKNIGWSKFSFKLIRIGSSSHMITYFKEHSKDPFFYGFLKNLYLNKICYECPFSTLPRQGDITLGDFWGVPKKYKDEKGVSVILANSERGLSVLKELVEKERIFSEEVSLETATKSNPRITSGYMKIPPQREKIFKEIHSRSWKYIEKKYIKPPTGIRGFIKRISSFSKRILKKILKKVTNSETV